MAEAVVRGFIEIEFVAEPLGIESPALDKGAEVEVATEFGVLSVFLGEGDLEVVTGDRFVEGEGHHFPFGTHVRGVKINGEGTRAAAVGGGAAIVGGAGVGCGGE